MRWFSFFIVVIWLFLAGVRAQTTFRLRSSTPLSRFCLYFLCDIILNLNEWQNFGQTAFNKIWESAQTSDIGIYRTKSPNLVPRDGTTATDLHGISEHEGDALTASHKWWRNKCGAWAHALGKLGVGKALGGWHTPDWVKRLGASEPVSSNRDQPITGLLSTTYCLSANFARTQNKLSVYMFLPTNAQLLSISPIPEKMCKLSANFTRNICRISCSAVTLLK